MTLEKFLMIYDLLLLEDPDLLEELSGGPLEPLLQSDYSAALKVDEITLSECNRDL